MVFNGHYCHKYSFNASVLCYLLIELFELCQLLKTRKFIICHFKSNETVKKIGTGCSYFVIYKVNYLS